MAARVQSQHAASASAPTTAADIRAQDLEEKLADASIPFRYSDGTTVKLQPRLREKYIDEYTCGELPKAFEKEALLDDPRYVCEHVLVGGSAADVAKNVANTSSTGMVNCDKKDRTNLKIRCRREAQEVNTGSG